MTSTPNQVIYGPPNDASVREAVQPLLGMSNVALLASTGYPAASITTNTVLSTIKLPHSGFKQLVAQLVAAAPASNVGDTLDIYVDSSIDGGITWINIIHFTQVLGNAAAANYVAITPWPTAGSYTVTTSDLGAAATPRALIGQDIRVRGTMVNTHTTTFIIAIIAEFN